MRALRATCSLHNASGRQFHLHCLADTEVFLRCKRTAVALRTVGAQTLAHVATNKRIHQLARRHIWDYNVRGSDTMNHVQYLELQNEPVTGRGQIDHKAMAAVVSRHSSESQRASAKTQCLDVFVSTAPRDGSVVAI